MKDFICAGDEVSRREEKQKMKETIYVEVIA